MTFELLTALVLLNLISTFALWGAVRKPERLKKKFGSAMRRARARRQHTPRSRFAR
jgi:hypothetical protein